MPGRLRVKRLVIRTLAFARRPELLAFLPAVTLAAFWAGGEEALLVTVFLVPMIYALAGILGAGPASELVLPGVDPVSGLPLRDTLAERLGRTGEAAEDGARGAACIAVMLDDADHLARRYGHEGFCEILRQTGARITGAVRRQDVVARLEGACFAAGLTPPARNDLETVLQMATRVQDAVEVPISLDATTVHVTASVGFCLSARAPAAGGGALLDAALAAMDDAHRNGPGAIRAFSPEIQRAHEDLAELRSDLGPALDSGQVQAFFQPQICTRTGDVSGFETLVRWVHPDRGVLAPADFLPGILEAGLSERLGEVMLTGALRALKAWDRAGLAIRRVAVNFAAEELRNPRLAEKIQWEIDRFGLTPDRLVVEIVETAVADSEDDVIVQTIARIAEMGCRIDLDDFGIGRASITNIRRFGVHRLKIDRALVARLDEDAEQQTLVAAVLSLAAKLGIESLAEGVETAAERQRLTELGCDHIQGYGIAKPMPLETATRWIASHRGTVGRAPLSADGSA